MQSGYLSYPVLTSLGTVLSGLPHARSKCLRAAGTWMPYFGILCTAASEQQRERACAGRDRPLSTSLSYLFILSSNLFVPHPYFFFDRTVRRSRNNTIKDP